MLLLSSSFYSSEKGMSRKLIAHASFLKNFKITNLLLFQDFLRLLFVDKRASFICLTKEGQTTLAYLQKAVEESLETKASWLS